MFVIPCKYNPSYPFIIQLVDDIRKYHKDEKIVVVDSSSDDKSYLKILKNKYDVIVEDITNKNWMIGAYWYAYKKYPDEEFYYFMHDSMRVKDNLDYMKKDDLTILMYFDRRGNYDDWGEKIVKETKYEFYNYNGMGCYGPIFFCKNKVMKKMLDMKADIILPKTKKETWYCERCYGFFLEEQGYDMVKCALYGDVFEIHSVRGKSGLAPHYTEWQYPIEKFYASYVDKKRL